MIDSGITQSHLAETAMMPTGSIGRRFEGRTALVTGASRGIGFSVAQRMLVEGAKVCITARHAQPLEAAAASLGKPDRVMAVAGSSDDPAHRDQTVDRVLERFGRLDVLVNNTGINPAYGLLDELDHELARKIFEVNVLASMAWTQLAARRWMGQHGGAVVNVASASGLRPVPGIGWYGLTKAALLRLTTQQAVELGPAIRVNAVAPDVIKTQFARALYADDEEAIAQRYTLKRLGVPHDVAAAVAFLASDDAAWVTGQTLLIDGGLNLNGADS